MDIGTQSPHGPVKVEIFDPPMCCSTGLCGPAVDPVLIDIYGAIVKIKTEYVDRVLVERYVLGQQADMFVKQPEVIRRLKADGVTVLPITVVNGLVQKERKYPSYAELRGWIDAQSG